MAGKAMLLLPPFFTNYFAGVYMSSETIGTSQDTKVKKQVLFALFTSVACLLACALYYHIFHGRAFVEIEIKVTEATEFKIYWAVEGQPYSEKRMAVASVHPEQSLYSFFLYNLRDLEKLRIDTHDYRGEATLGRVTIRQEGFDTLSIDSVDRFKAFTPLNQVEEFFLDNEGLVVRSSGVDPNFELLISPHYIGYDKIWLSIRLAAICLVVFGACWYGRPLAVDLKFVPVFLFGIWMLIIVMMVNSDQNVHPDEYVHLAAVQYYADHWLPPDITDPSIDHTFSVYGVSRLSSLEIYYLLAGKFKSLISSIELPDHVSSRMFNILLWGAIFFYGLKRISGRIVALPLLLTPQVWYIFSYCNSDAFALFVAFLGGSQLVDKNSLLFRYLRGDNMFSRVFGVILIGLLLATLLLLKKNYLPFIAFFYLCLLFRLFFTEEFYWDRKDALIRLIAFTLLGCALFGLRLGIDHYVNGENGQAKIEAMKNSKGHPSYRPASPLADTNHFLFKKAKGVTWQEMISKYKWPERCLNNFFGTFGYGNIKAQLIYYQIMRWATVFFLVLVVGTAIVRGGIAGGGVVMAACALAGALVLASFYHSWVGDFQPQGRYLFMILPMLGVVYGWNYTLVHRQGITLVATMMFLFSSYFFVFQGLLRIPQVMH